jgi:hypothetical protein
VGMADCRGNGVSWWSRRTRQSPSYRGSVAISTHHAANHPNRDIHPGCDVQSPSPVVTTERSTPRASQDRLRTATGHEPGGHTNTLAATRRSPHPAHHGGTSNPRLTCTNDFARHPGWISGRRSDHLDLDQARGQCFLTRTALKQRPGWCLCEHSSAAGRSLDLRPARSRRATCRRPGGGTMGQFLRVTALPQHLRRGVAKRGRRGREPDRTPGR